jgi:hypothetical protein
VYLFSGVEKDSITSDIKDYWIERVYKLFRAMNTELWIRHRGAQGSCRAVETGLKMHMYSKNCLQFE